MIKKKIITALVSACFLTGFSATAFAEGNTAGIGVIDSQQIVQKSDLFPALKRVEGDLKKIVESYNKELELRNNKIKDAIKQKKSEQEIKKLQAQYEKELTAKQEANKKLLEQKQKELQTIRQKLQERVQVAIKEIAAKKNLAYVVEKQDVYLGGTDITQDVITKIK